MLSLLKHSKTPLLQFAFHVFQNILSNGKDLTLQVALLLEAAKSNGSIPWKSPSIQHDYFERKISFEYKHSDLFD